MKKYRVTLDGGEGGEEIVEARDELWALGMAESWAQCGYWRVSGEVTVAVEDMEGNELASSTVWVEASEEV